MTDRRRWDDRYARLGPPRLDEVRPPSFLAPHTNLLPVDGQAIDIACGQGRNAVWLATRGLRVWGLDISAVATAHARDLARRSEFGDRCQFDAVDLDRGLPDGPPVQMILCNKFRDHRLDDQLIERLAPGGMLAIAVLSQVGASPGRFRAVPGELTTAFAALDVVDAGEGGGVAWLLARR